MFKTALIVLAALAPSVASAQDAPLCPTVGALAASVMEARQANAPMSELIEVMPAEMTDPRANHLTLAIILDAYSRPGFVTRANQQRAIAEFRADVEFSCYSATL